MGGTRLELFRPTEGETPLIAADLRHVFEAEAAGMRLPISPSPFPAQAGSLRAIALALASWRQILRKLYCKNLLCVIRWVQ
jgi:hypothetical protein